MPEEPLLRLHYRGHSSFVLRFEDGVSVLTDYGKSNTFGLDSPIHDLGDLHPYVVLYSHHDEDHDRGDEFPGALRRVVIQSGAALLGHRVQALANRLDVATEVIETG